MSDLIRKSDALEAVAGWEIPSTAIAALPAVTVGVRPLVWGYLGLTYRAFDPIDGQTVYAENKEDMDRIEAERQRRILAALTAQPAPDIERLIKDAERRGQIKAGAIFANYGTNEADYAETVQNACPYCNGSGHKDDVKPAPDAAAIREATARLQKLAYWLNTDAEVLADMDQRDLSDHQHIQAEVNAILALIGKEGVPDTQAVRDAERFEKADWFWRVLDPDDSGDTPEEAINRGMIPLLCVCQIASSYTGPVRFGFIAPSLDPESDEDEFLHFATEEEAIAAAKERRALLPKGGA